MPALLDWLRASFIYIVAFLLPLAGAVIALIRVTEGDRDEGARIAAAAVLGAGAYAILLMS